MSIDLVTSAATRVDQSPASKRPTRIICYAWGDAYVDILLTLTLPALLAPGNLPFLASEVPCTLIILTERRFFAKLDSAQVIAEIRKHCPVRMVKLDDLLVAKDKYGMSLTYVLHRGFSDLGEEMVNQWQIFLNADFIMADGNLQNVIAELSRGARVVASPSYCVDAEGVLPKLRKQVDPSNSTLCISHRELAQLILAHRHSVIRGKTVNQQEFHMRYMDQFYWSVDDDALLGFQMPVAIVGLHPQRYVAEPNAYWDYGLIWEYCPDAEICCLGDSDQFTMLELRSRAVAQEQIVAGRPDMSAIANLMITWVTPYQSHFLNFPLTLHARDLTASIEPARGNLQAFVDEVISLTPPLPSHINHPQWEYHAPGFKMQRSFSYKLRSSLVARYGQAKSFLRSSAVAIATRAGKPMLRPIVRPVVRIGRPMLRRAGLEILKSTTVADFLAQIDQLGAELSARDSHIAQLTADKNARDSHIAQLTADKNARDSHIAQLTADKNARDSHIAQLTADVSALAVDNNARDNHIAQLTAEVLALSEKAARVTELTNIVTEYQLKLERAYNYQSIMAEDQIRQGLSHLEPEFLSLYENCRQYTMTSWERMYALYKSVRYVVDNEIPGDFVECGTWRGGSMKLVAHVLLSLGVTDRKLYLYDTFEGMTEPDPTVDLDFAGNNAINDWNEAQRRNVKWAYAPIDEVHQIMTQTGYPMDRVLLIKGPVERTIPTTMPDKIALLRLDTDWYASTLHEMDHLYPLLSPGGVLILDDYGHYKGAARAVDEHLTKLRKKPLLQRVDYSCRAAIKPGP